jgi:thiamine-phosphate pyrophosphorylase
MSRSRIAGVRLFQYRNKNGSRKAVYETSIRLAKIARDTDATFIVNDYADIAVAVDADGVHLGQDDFPIEQARRLLGPAKLIGISTHSLGQAVEAEHQGADYIGFGPIFASTTKGAGTIQGIVGLTTIRKSVTIPIIAIGGIKQETVADVIRGGADCVAIIGAILTAEDLADAATSILRIIDDISLSGGAR